MSLVRNGGFERGDTHFWTSEVTGALEINDTDQKYGAYCGKYISGGDASEFIMNNDYVKVSPHDLTEIMVWVKSTAAREVIPCIYLYDSDYSYLGYSQGFSRVMTSAYMSCNSQIHVGEGVSYIRAGLRIYGSCVDEIFYIDGFIFDIIKPESCVSGELTLAVLDSKTVSGNTRLDRRDVKQYKTIEAELYVNTANGTSPTLDVEVYETGIGGYKYLVGTFSQATGVGSERITLTHLTGNQLHLEYTIGGTSPLFYAWVYLMGKGL